MSPVYARSLLAVTLLLGSSRMLAAQSKVTGWSYTLNMSVDSGNGRKSSMAMRHQITDHALRMEFVQVSGMGETSGAEGTYTILNDRDSTMTMVMPSQRMATVNSMSQLGGIFSGGTPKLSYHVTRNDLQDLGPGGTILGHATRRYRLVSSGSFEITIGGRTCSRQINGDSEMWIAPDVDMGPAYEAMGKRYAAIGAMVDVAKPDASGVKLPKGTALRTIGRSSYTPQGGQPVTVTSTTEYVEIAHGPIDAALFEVPDGFKTIDTRALIADLPAGMMDSILAAQADKPDSPLCGKTH